MNYVVRPEDINALSFRLPRIDLPSLTGPQPPRTRGTRILFTPPIIPFFTPQTTGRQRCRALLERVQDPAVKEILDFLL